MNKPTLFIPADIEMEKRFRALMQERAEKMDQTQPGYWNDCAVAADLHVAATLCRPVREIATVE